MAFLNLGLQAFMLLVGAGMMVVVCRHPRFGLGQRALANSDPRIAAPRSLAMGVLVGSAATLVGWGGALIFSAPPVASVFEWFPGVEFVALAAVATLLAFFQAETGAADERRWLLVSATAASAIAVVTSHIASHFDSRVELSAASTAVLAAVACVLMIGSGRRQKLVVRAYNALVRVTGDGVVVVDRHNRVLDANTRACETLRLSDPAGWEAERPIAPTAIRELLESPDRQRARLKSASGRYFEAWTTMLDGVGPLSGARAVLLRDVTTRRLDERRLVHLAHYDSLTGLANRRLFLESLAQTVEATRDSGKRGALFYIDLDHFKGINDSLGHAAGDALLQTLGERFRHHLKNKELVPFGVPRDAEVQIARLAGDEFAVIAPRVTDSEAAAEMARYIIAFISRPTELADQTFVSTASIGVALMPEDGDDAEELIRHADAALYVAKSRGRNRFARFEASFEAEADHERKLDEGLRYALDNGELMLHYQPKVEMTSGTVVGFEALLRWRSATLGDVGPAEFIPIAEARGLICEIGSWCLDEACRQMKEWADTGLAVVPVSVNVSSAQFVETDLQRIVSDALKDHSIEPRMLELELTESLLLEDDKDSELTLRDLRSIGVKIALDDFGTGYSALTYLNRFSLDVLKIDRSLLREIDNDSSAEGIASAVVSMAHSLGLTVVAEGIDLESQLEPLAAMGCDQIQGFLYAPALPPDHARRYLASRGERPPVAKPNAGLPALRTLSLGMKRDDGSEDMLPAFKSEAASDVTEPAMKAPDEVQAMRDKLDGRVLLVDDGEGTIGPLALRFGRLGIDLHYASEVDEARLFVAQEKDAIRMLAVPPNFDLARASEILDLMEKEIGTRPRFVVLGEEPDKQRCDEIRGAGASWVLWAPFTDAELRYIVRCAVALPHELYERTETRIPVDMTANIRAGDRRYVAVLSSLSSRGAFIELSDLLPVGSPLQIEFEMEHGRFRGFARVVYQQREEPERGLATSGLGVVFFGTDRSAEQILRTAVKAREARYLP